MSLSSQSTRTLWKRTATTNALRPMSPVVRQTSLLRHVGCILVSEHTVLRSQGRGWWKTMYIPFPMQLDLTGEKLPEHVQHVNTTNYKRKRHGGMFAAVQSPCQVDGETLDLSQKHVISPGRHNTGSMQYGRPSGERGSALRTQNCYSFGTVRPLSRLMQAIRRTKKEIRRT